MKLPLIIFKEPITHFILASLLIFAVNYWTSGSQKEVIVINSQVRDYLVNAHEELRLKTLSEAEIAEVVENYIREEVLYREAYKRGLDKSDSRMRRNMIRKIYGLLAGKVPEPTEQNLRVFFNNNPEKFYQPATFVLNQVYFKDPSAIPDDISIILGKDEGTSEIGDTMMDFGRIIKNATPQLIARNFGSEAAKAVLSAKDTRWFGPFQSRYGVHFFRIQERVPASQWAYEDVSSNLPYLWRRAQIEKMMDDEFETISLGYQVVYEYEEDK
jgi:PPIC-type PPIASE domain